MSTLSLIMTQDVPGKAAFHKAAAELESGSSIAHLKEVAA